MEAVPKLPMLRFDLKLSPENVDFGAKLKPLIQAKFGEDPSGFGREISDLETLRANACIRPTEDLSGCATVKKYYCQLHFLRNKFKSNQLFESTWYDIYTGSTVTYDDIQYEMASVLYNVGTLHSILGAQEMRISSEGMKVACTHFQCAAWAFHTLPDRYKVHAGTDLTGDLMAFLSQVCLAQAQECILEKSILDNRKSSIIAKVGMQVVDYYKQALKTIEHSINKKDEESIPDAVGSTQANKWLKFIEFKVRYYQAMTVFYVGLQAEEAQKMGERVAYFQRASDRLGMAVKISKNVEVDRALVGSCLNFTSDVINGKLEISKRENEFIYHEKVPDFDTLQDVKGASLVKGIGFDVTDAEVSGGDIFARLVPMETHEAASLYSEEKAKLLRRLGQEIEDRNSDLSLFMSSLQLDEVPKPGEHLSLPQELIECAAGLSVKKEAVQRLTDAMARIAAVSADVQTSLADIRSLLKDDEEQETEYQAILGKRNSPLNPELERETQKYEEAHSMASSSNMTLRKAMELHLGGLRLLGKPLQELEKEIPSMEDLDDESEANIAEVHRILNKVDEMKIQRVMLADKLREEIQSDDIGKKLTVAKDFEELFDREMKKFEPQVKIIRQNLAAQDNILQALTEVNARYAETRKVVLEVINARNDMIGSLVAAYHAYEDLLHKAAKGLEFYDKLDSNVSKLLNKVKGVVTKRQEERDAKLATKAPALPDLGRMPVMADLGGVSDILGGVADPPPPTGKPTLKDYLKIMKEGKDASAAFASMNIGTSTGAPAVRPAPVGSESQPPVSSAMEGNVHQPGYPGYVPVGAPQQQRVPFAYPPQQSYPSQQPQQQPAMSYASAMTPQKLEEVKKPEAVSQQQPQGGYHQPQQQPPVGQQPAHMSYTNPMTPPLQQQQQPIPAERPEAGNGQQQQQPYQQPYQPQSVGQVYSYPTSPQKTATSMYQPNTSQSYQLPTSIPASTVSQTSYQPTAQAVQHPAVATSQQGYSYPSQQPIPQSTPQQSFPQHQQQGYPQGSNASQVQQGYPQGSNASQVQQGYLPTSHPQSYQSPQHGVVASQSPVRPAQPQLQSTQHQPSSVSGSYPTEQQQYPVHQQQGHQFTQQHVPGYSQPQQQMSQQHQMSQQQRLPQHMSPQQQMPQQQPVSNQQQKIPAYAQQHHMQQLPQQWMANQQQIAPQQQVPAYPQPQHQALPQQQMQQPQQLPQQQQMQQPQQQPQQQMLQPQKLPQQQILQPQKVSQQQILQPQKLPQPQRMPNQQQAPRPQQPYSHTPQQQPASPQQQVPQSQQMTNQQQIPQSQQMTNQQHIRPQPQGAAYPQPHQPMLQPQQLQQQRMPNQQAAQRMQQQLSLQPQGYLYAQQQPHPIPQGGHQVTATAGNNNAAVVTVMSSNVRPTAHTQEQQFQPSYPVPTSCPQQSYASYPVTPQVPQSTAFASQQQWNLRPVVPQPGTSAGMGTSASAMSTVASGTGGMNTSASAGGMGAVSQQHPAYGQQPPMLQPQKVQDLLS